MTATDPSPSSARTSDAPPVVGVGASAGGLAAFRALLAAVPERSGIAWVLLQHLDPSHESHVAELLDKTTPLPVAEIRDGTAVEPDHVYVLPPDAYATISGGVLRLEPPVEQRGLRLSIDWFFRSLAEDRAEHAVGVVLSGTGSDGTAGLRAIKAAGGLAVVQDPASAAHDGMPRSALVAGVADLVLRIEEIPAAIRRYVEHPYVVRSETETLPTGEGSDLDAVIALVKARVDLDVSPYKASTLERRVHRRMGLHHVADVAEYLSILRGDEQELGRLAKDLLIRVTEFFRDADAFEHLRATAVPALLRRAAGYGELRVWVAGCATGEEAYSLAFMLLEAMRSLEVDVPLRIFATDVDESAIAAARAGVYTAGSLANVPADLCERYFERQEDERFRVAKVARDCVSFAVHDLLREAPFSRIDLVSCRNLLIYLRREVQPDVMGLFHFALRPDGVLFLGTSETPAVGPDMFQTLSTDHRIYRRVGRDRRARIRLPLTPGRPPRPPERATGSGRGAPAKSDLRATAAEALLASVVPAALVVDPEQKVLYLHGDLDPWLDLPRGEADFDLMKLLKGDVRTRVRAALYRAMRGGESVAARVRDGFRVTVSPAPTAEAGGLWVVRFDPAEDAPASAASAPPNAARSVEDEALLRQLEAELEATREDLRNTIEELETSNEELKSSNEESMSMNEELQSTNEELEASSEELRSLNEELSTVNAALREKVVEVEEARNDVANFLASTRVATLFLGPDLRLRRFTPAAKTLIGLEDDDVGRQAAAALRGFGDDALEEDARGVLRDLGPTEVELRVRGGRWLRRRILPYRTADDHIEGLVVVYTDVSELRRALRRAERRSERQAIVSELGLEALRGADLEEILKRAAERVVGALGVPYCKILELRPATNDLLLRAGVGWRASVVGAVTVPIDTGSPGVLTLRSKEAVVVRDLEEDPRFLDNRLLREHGIRSGMSCVIEGRGGPWGVLGAFSREAGRFDDADASFLQSVANTLGTVIQRQESERAVRESERRLRLLTDSLPALISYVDRDLRYRFNNREYTRWFGLEASEIEGRRLPEVLGEEAFEQVRPRVERVLAGELVRFEDELPYRRGGTRQVSVTYVPDRDEPDGEVRGWYALIQDISDRKRVEEELRRSQDRLAAHAERLEEADRNKDKFLAVLGHELRNPLGAIVNATRILSGEEERLGDRATWALRMMRDQAENMTRLLNDLLDVSRISRGKLSLSLETVDLAPVVERAVDWVRPALETKGQHLVVEVGPGGPVVSGDRVRLEQVVLNLLSNAVRYTREGGNLRVEVRSDEDEVRIAVADDGRGLTDVELEQIFDPFFQADGNGSEHLGGLGIGLTLVRQIVELHGGRVSAKSAGRDRGATFTVTLPRDRAAAREAVPAPPAGEPSATRPLSILVVDDNEDAAAALALILETEGHRVERVSDGQSAVLAAAKSRADVLLLDLGLPDIDGFEVLDRIRKRGDLPGTLVAMTGFGDPQSSRRVADAGFHHHMLKPLDFEKLMRILREIPERPFADPV